MKSSIWFLQQRLVAYPDCVLLLLCQCLFHPAHLKYWIGWAWHACSAFAHLLGEVQWPWPSVYASALLSLRSLLLSAQLHLDLRLRLGDAQQWCSNWDKIIELQSGLAAHFFHDVVVSRHCVYICWFAPKVFAPSQCQWLGTVAQICWTLCLLERICNWSDHPRSFSPSVLEVTNCLYITGHDVFERPVHFCNLEVLDMLRTHCRIARHPVMHRA